MSKQITLRSFNFSILSYFPTSQFEQIRFRKNTLVYIMEQRFFQNPYEDYKEQPFEIDKGGIRELIQNYVGIILNGTREEADSRGDLYVGDAGNFGKFPF